MGNRLTKDTDDYTYDAADQLTDLEGTSFDYDDNGNQTSRGSDTFEYDIELWETGGGTPLHLAEASGEVDNPP